jgi:NAD(P)-dependent dehydrogenase (short-subunit alcohol dehydrogenase family)
MGGILDLSPEKFDECFKANCAGAFYAAQQVLPAMVEAGRGTVLLTGATAALRGGARFSALAVGKFGLRALAQSMAREFGPQGVHVAHVVVDGQIDTPRVREMSPDREDHTMLSPDAIAETYWQLHSQHRTAWTLELDLRPAVESF